MKTTAADGAGGIEEVIVTAQRTAESIQDVPIAVTALTGDMLDDKQVITISDLQMNAPNVSFTPTNFGSNSFSYRPRPQFDNFSVGLVGGYNEGQYVSMQDYGMDVGAELLPNSYTGPPFYPISAPAGGRGDSEPGPCNYADGTAGHFGGCILLDDLTRNYSYPGLCQDGVDSRLPGPYKRRLNRLPMEGSAIVQKLGLG